METTDKNKLLTQIKKDFNLYKNAVKGAQWDLNSKTLQDLPLFIPMPYYQYFRAGTMDTNLPDTQGFPDLIKEHLGWDYDWDFPDLIQSITSIPKVLIDIEETYNRLALFFIKHGISDEDYDMVPLYTESVLLFAAATKTWGYCNSILDDFLDIMAKHFKGDDYEALFNNHKVSEEVYLKRIQDMQPVLHTMVTWHYGLSNL